MSNLGPQQQNVSYDGILQIPGGVTAQLQQVQDGSGRGTGLFVSSAGVNATTADSFAASINGTSIQNVSPRLISDGFGDYVSVKDFGAAGDGVTDDTTAIQNAIDSISNLGGGAVYLPAGTYIVSGITIKSSVIIGGAGRYNTTIKLKNNSNTDVIQSLNVTSLWTSGSNDGEYGFGIQNLCIDGNRSNNTAGCGLKLYGFSFTLNDLLIQNCEESGISSRWGNGSAVTPNILMEATITQVSVLENGQHGIYWSGPHDSYFGNVIVSQNSQSAANTYHGVWVDTQYTAPVYVGNSAFDYLHVWGVNHNIALRLDGGCFLSNSQVEGANIDLYINANDCVFTGGLIYGVGGSPSGTGDIGVYINGKSGTFIQSKVINTDGGLIEFAGSTVNSDINIQGYNSTGNAIVGTPSGSDNINLFLQAATGTSYSLYRWSRTSGSVAVEATDDNVYLNDGTINVKGSQVSIGTNAPDPNNIVDCYKDGLSRITQNVFGNYPVFLTQRASGTYSLPSNVSSGDETLRLEGRGYYGGSYYQNGLISIKQTGSPGASSMPGSIVFATTDTTHDFAQDRVSLLPTGNFAPVSDNAYSCGQSGNRWSSIWAANGTIQTSDAREKTNTADSALGLDFVNALRPVSFNWVSGSKKIVGQKFYTADGIEIKEGESIPDDAIRGEMVEENIAGERTHWGLIAQEVKAVCDASGVDFGGWILSDKTDPDSQQGLRYDQFIAPLIKAVQELSEKVSKLEGK